MHTPIQPTIDKSLCLFYRGSMNGSKTTIDDLARMVKSGFDSVSDEIGEVKHEVVRLREQNEREHLDLKLRQDNVAYRFELQDLDKRVTQLEKQAKFV